MANALAGLVALSAWQWPRLRGRWVWGLTIAAEAALLAQVVLGVVLVASERHATTNIHMFYGFIGFLTVGLAYQYRDMLRQSTLGSRWRSVELFYGVVGLFLMGIGIRALMETT